MKEIRLLTKDEIEVKVKQVSEKGAQALLYKTSRVDMAILDETFGITNWTNEYRDIDGVLYCGIGIRESGDEPFVWKWSNGIESRSDGEGNEVKGEASDALKRAGFLCGIGRELYTAPFIFLNVETQPQTDKDGKKVYKNGKLQWELKDRFSKYKVDDIEYNDDRSIKRVVISDKDGNIVFGANRAYPKKEPKKDDFSTVPTKKAETPKNDIIDANVLTDIYETAKATVGVANAALWIEKKFKKEKFEQLTTAEANALLSAMKKNA